MAERHLDRRQVLRALLLAGAGLALPAACGVPGEGGPIVDGPGPTYDPISRKGNLPPDPAGVTDPRTLVELFLAAISGPLETQEQLNAARERARKFLTREASDSWTSGTTEQVTVVRVSGLDSATKDPNAQTVVGTLQPVGQFLTAQGAVGQYAGSAAPTQVTFTVVPADDQSGGLRISRLPPSLPPGLLLSTDALGKYYVPQVIYFWDIARRGLVPDLRYVPNTQVVDSVQLAAIVNWLIGGPAELLLPVANNTIPNGTTLIGPNVVIRGDRLEVNFSPALLGADLAKVMAQLRWSLHPLHELTSGPVQLQIASRPQQVDGSSDPYKAANLADDTTRDSEPRPFGVISGAIEALEAPWTLPAVLARAEYKVVLAALSRDNRAAALLTTGHALMLGRADDGGAVSYLQASLPGQRWSRPAWLPSGRRLLVIVDGRLCAVTAAGAASTLLGDVDSFAVAPDGYRIALVRQGALAIGALRTDGEQPTIGPVRPIDAGLTDIGGVAWTRLDRVVVAGKRGSGNWGLAEVTVDGAILEAWKGGFPVPIDWVVAYPKLPSQTPGPGPVMVQTREGNAFRVFANTSPTANSATTGLQGRPPSPSPSGSTPATRPAPTAPFYPD